MLNHPRKPILFIVLTLALALHSLAAAQEDTPRLVIESIGLDAPITVAPFVAELGTWDFAQIDREVALLEWMPRFGDPGNSIVAGHHLDTAVQPSTLYRLNEVQVGDEILVQDGDRLLSYTVSDTFITDTDDLSVLGSSSDERLTLFTCHGAYDQRSGTYQQRFVVVAQRNTEPSPCVFCIQDTLRGDGRGRVSLQLRHQSKLA